MAEKDAAKKSDAKEEAVAAPAAKEPAGASAKEAIADVSEHIAHIGDTLSPLKRYSTVAGRLLVVVGLFVVVLARGCDAVGARKAAAAQARLAVERNEFDDDWKATIEDKQEDVDDTQKRINELEAKAERTEAENKELEDKRKDLENQRKAVRDKQKERDDAREKLQKGYWRDLEITARDARSKQQIKAAGREGWFVFGTVVLVFGLLIVGSIAQGPERWLSLVVLAIIVLSYYRAIVAVGGM